MEATTTLNIILDGLEELVNRPDDEALRGDIAFHLKSLSEHLAGGGLPPDVREAFESAGYEFIT